MSFKPYTGSFDALTGSIFASWFALGPRGPMVYAVGYAEMSDGPWSLFYRRISPAGGRAHVGAGIKEQLSALSEDFGEMFFNFMLGLNNYLILIGTDEPFLPQAPAFIRTNGNPLVDATMRWLIESSPEFFDLDWEREWCLRRTYGARLPAEELAYRRCKNQQPSSPEASFGRWWDLVTDIGHAERSAIQFAQSWIKAERDHLRECSTLSFSEVSEFYDSFHLPLPTSQLNGKLWRI
jgi:hypothetical protein